MLRCFAGALSHEEPEPQWWVWDTNARMGWWINKFGQHTQHSGFQLDYVLSCVSHGTFEEIPFPPCGDPDFLMDEGL